VTEILHIFGVGVWKSEYDT